MVNFDPSKKLLWARCLEGGENQQVMIQVLDDALDGVGTMALSQQDAEYLLHMLWHELGCKPINCENIAHEEGSIPSFEVVSELRLDQPSA
jgi:hypothetical protein